jgi:hypothetical protein
MISMNNQINELDETRLKAIFKQAYYNRKISSPDLFRISIAHLESLKHLKQKARRIDPEKV